MKILIVATLDSTHTIRWANGLRERGHQIIVFSTRRPLPGLSKEVKTIVHPRFGRSAYLLYGWTLRRVVGAERPDVVHVMYASGFGLLASTWLRRGSYVLSMLGTDIFDFPKTRTRRWILKRNLAHAGVLLSTSEAMRREARQYADATAAPIRLTPFGVDIDVFRPTTGEALRSMLGAPLRIGTARRLERTYGIDTLIEAIALLRRGGVAGLELQIAGEGSERAKLMALVSRLGLTDCIRFLGWLPHDQMPQFLGQLDIFCVLSRSESFGVAALEASACGLPVLASRIGGLPETIVDGETGILVEPDSPQDAAGGLRRLYEDEALRTRLGHSGRKHVRQCYDWRQSLDVMEQIYADLGPHLK